MKRMMSRSERRAYFIPLEQGLRSGVIQQLIWIPQLNHIGN